MVRTTLAILFGLSLGCGDEGGFPVDAGIDAPIPGGKFSIAWSITGGAATCADAGATIVSINVHEVNEIGASTEAFGCQAMTATSREFTPGVYEFRFTLKGSGNDIATSPLQGNVMLQSSQTTALMPITFTVP
jgi:hypothetical protein